MRFWAIFSVALSVLLGGCSAHESEGPKCEPARCEVGRSLSCGCVDGRTGAQVCQRDGTWAACECTGAFTNNLNQGAAPPAPQIAQSPSPAPGSTRANSSKQKAKILRLTPQPVDDEIPTLAPPVVTVDPDEVVGGIPGAAQLRGSE